MVKYMNETEEIKASLDTIVEVLSNINNLLYFIADDIKKKNEEEAKVIVKTHKGAKFYG
jgi:hypothetical protein